MSLLGDKGGCFWFKAVLFVLLSGLLLLLLIDAKFKVLLLLISFVDMVRGSWDLWCSYCEASFVFEEYIFICYFNNATYCRSLKFSFSKSSYWKFFPFKNYFNLFYSSILFDLYAYSSFYSCLNSSKSIIFFFYTDIVGR